MVDRLLVGTRKGLFILERPTGAPPRKKAGRKATARKARQRSAAARKPAGKANSGWKIVRTAFLGEPVAMGLEDPRDGTLYAVLNLGHFGNKLHRSTDRGRKWEEVGVPVYPAGAKTLGRSFDPNAPGPADPANLELLWSLEPGGPKEAGVLWAGTIPGGLFRSSDRGTTWELNQALWDRPERMEWSGGGYDHAGIHSICVDPTDPRKLKVAISIGGVWHSDDGGATWACRGEGMRAAYLPPEMAYLPNRQDAHRMVQSPTNPDELWVQHHNGIFRTTDGARHWKELKAKPSTFGFAVAVHPKQANSAWFVPAVADQCRVPVDGKMVVTRTDNGGRTFEALHKGLPQAHAYHLIYRHGLAVDGSGERLAMGSTTGALWSSLDGGESWHTITTDLPPIYFVRNGA